MKNSISLSTLLPTAFAICAVVGCSHAGSSTRTAAPSPRTERSTATVTADDIGRSPSATVEELLIARVPGLMVTRAANGRTVMHLRGITTLDDASEPLFVVDDVTLYSSSSLAAVSLFDIASIDVFRDPASTAAWGIRGSNGVIVIKTKHS